MANEMIDNSKRAHGNDGQWQKHVCGHNREDFAANIANVRRFTVSGLSYVSKLDCYMFATLLHSGFYSKIGQKRITNTDMTAKEMLERIIPAR